MSDLLDVSAATCRSYGHISSGAVSGTQIISLEDIGAPVTHSLNKHTCYTVYRLYYVISKKDFLDEGTV